MRPEVTEQGEAETPALLGEGGKREDRVRADSQNLGIGVREPLEVCIERGQLRLSDRGEGHDEERQQDVLLSLVA